MLRISQIHCTGTTFNHPILNLFNFFSKKHAYSFLDRTAPRKSKGLSVHLSLSMSWQSHLQNSFFRVQLISTTKQTCIHTSRTYYQLKPTKCVLQEIISEKLLLSSVDILAVNSNLFHGLILHLH